MERRRRFDEDPDDEFEKLFQDPDEDDLLGDPFEEEADAEEIEAQLQRLFGGDVSNELEERPPRYDKGRELEVHVMGVYERIEHGQPRALLVQLRDNYGRVVPIVIGPFEAHAIVSAINDDAPPRPMTHDLIRNILTRLGVSIDRVLIDDLWQGTFYAKLYLLHGDEEIEIDARPSDAIALAVRFRAPIYMAESVLEEEGQPEDYS